MTSESPGAVKRRIRIMIVEDEADIREIVSQMLGPYYEVVRADNGLEALERLNWYEPDVTIMDLMMPVLDGFDTTRAIKKDNDYATMPVLFLTARKDNRAVREALMAGGDVYLEKPFDPPELLVRLQEMISRNNIAAKPKRYTLLDIQAHFSETIENTAVVPPPDSKGMSLTEQLARAAAKPKARILVIHESEQVLTTIKQTLKNRYEVIISGDAEAALDKIAAYQPDVLVFSTKMPTMSGLQFAQLLRVNKQFLIPHVVFMTANDGSSLKVEGKHLGICINVGSPPDTRPIEDAIDRITSDPDFNRRLKRLDFREILRREDPADDEF